MASVIPAATPIMLPKDQSPHLGDITEGNLRPDAKSRLEVKDLHPGSPSPIIHWQDKSTPASDKSAVDAGKMCGSGYDADGASDDDEPEDKEGEEDFKDTEDEGPNANARNRFCGGYRPKGNPRPGQPTSSGSASHPKPIRR